ncbi:MAG: hypothetical protein ACQEVA_18825 [Myxococcota bacterium]
MNSYDKLRHKLMIWGGLLGVITVAATLLSMHFARTDLSAEVFDSAITACADATEPGVCRDRVEDLHDDCYRWSLTRHDEYPEIDRDKYADCLEHPPGKFKSSSN